MNDWETIGPQPQEKSPPPARHLPGRFPLLWVLLPLLAGYLAALADIRIPVTLLWAAAVAAACAALAAAFRKGDAKHHDTVWATAFCTGVFCAGVLWHGVACPPPPDRGSLPAREAVLSVRVDELFATRFGATSGIGVVTGAPRHLQELEGARLQFRATRGTGDPGFDLGATVRLRGVLENAGDGEGFAQYLKRRGVPFTLSRATSEAVEIPATAFRRACTRARERVSQALETGVDEAGAARLKALMLGRTALLPEEEREDFRRAGATHLFAISGLHITGIAAGLLWAARRLRVSDTFAAPAVLGALWLYVQMAGAPPSATRAWIMSAALFGAAALGRGARPAAGLTLAATGTLIAEPGALRDPGFLLSYLVVAAILLYAVPGARALETAWRPWRFVPPDALGMRRRLVLAARRPALGALATSWACTLAGAPLVAALFGNVAPVGLAANLALVPLSAPPVILGFLASALGAAGAPALAAPFNAGGAFFMDLLARGAHLAARVPGGAWTTGACPAWSPAVGGVTVLAALLAWPVRPDRSALRYLTLPIVSLAAYAICTAG